MVSHIEALYLLLSPYQIILSPSLLTPDVTSLSAHSCMRRHPDGQVAHQREGRLRQGPRVARRYPHRAPGGSGPPARPDPGRGAEADPGRAHGGDYEQRGKGGVPSV